MKGKKRLIFMFMVLCLTLAGIMNAYAASDRYANRMNVVFVIDASGSMTGTDGSGWRFEAVDLFLGLSTESGNYMGSVVFDDEIVLKRDLQPMDGLSAKSALSQEIRQAEVSGDTDIGGAIELATQMLNDSGNPNLRSAIILLSDGNTDIPASKGADGLARSEASKQNAIATARQNGYPIYCVCLNANNAADPQELQEIADATGGKFVEVKSAEGLKDVFNQFYSIIYDTDTVTLADEKIPDSGSMDIPFTVPAVGVEEANIIIRTLNPNTSYAIFQPNGTAFTESELNDMRITANTFSVIKIPQPASGDWKITVRGIPGDDVKIDMVINTDYQVEIAAAGNVFAPGDTASFTATLLEAGNPVTDPNSYAQYPAEIFFKDTSTGSVASAPMMASGASYIYDYQVPGEGEWNVYAKVTVDASEQTSAAVTITSALNNTAPKWLKKEIKIKEGIWPFTKAVYEEDVTPDVTDAEDPVLEFSIIDSDIDESLLDIQDGVIQLQIKECGDGEFKVRAMDPHGLYSDIPATVSTTNMTIILVVILIILLLLIVLAIVIMMMVKNNKRFNGEVMVISFNYEDGETSTPQTFDPGKGKVPLYRYVSEAGGLDLRKCSLMATGGDFIWFMSGEGYYSSNSPDTKSKKIRLDGDIEVTISKNQDMESGIRITFMPYRM